MKRLITIALFFLAMHATAQNAQTLLKEADNYERLLKEDLALEKYKALLAIEPANMQAMVKAAELSCGIGARQSDKKIKKQYYDAAKVYADKALAIDAKHADANYVRAVVAGKLTEIESENKKIVANVKDIRTFADKALAINSQHARANYVLGKWNFEMINLSWAKRAAVKVFYGGLPEAKMEDAIRYMEQARSLDKYFVLNYLDLAKAYKFDNNPTKAIEILKLLAKLPTRTADDAGLKSEGKKILDEMQ